MKKLMLAAMMMGMVAVTPVMAHASETEDTAVEAAMTEADENITQHAVLSRPRSRMRISHRSSTGARTWKKKWPIRATAECSTQLTS